MNEEGITQAVEGALESIVSPEEVGKLIRTPKPEMGDVALCCHPLARTLKKSPNDIANDLASSLRTSLDSSVRDITAEGGYVNFTFDDLQLAEEVLKEIQGNPNTFGNSNVNEGKKVVIDFSAPNLGKPMHVGHIRSTILGDAMRRIFTATGYETHGINYLGDVGLHIGKLIAAYERWGNRSALDANPEKEMFNLYVRFGKEAEADKSLETQARDVLARIEGGDEAMNALWQDIGVWSKTAFNRVYDLLDVSFDETTGQSFFSEPGKQIVQKALDEGIATHDDNGGVQIAFGEGGKLPPKVILRSDGTAIYATQDLASAIHRYEQHAFDRMVYVVGEEQELYFKQLFAALQRMGHGWAEACEHLKFGHILLKEGRMSTREGKVVFLEDVVGKAVELAKERVNDDVPNASEVAKALGIGSLKYQVLSVDPTKQIKFSWDRAFDASGKSGPYIQYAHARAQSILDRVEEGDVDFSTFQKPYERRLVRRLAAIPGVVKRAAEQLRPDFLAVHAFDTAKTFNDWYQNERIVDSADEASKVHLLGATQTAFKRMGDLLGIQMPERM